MAKTVQDINKGLTKLDTILGQIQSSKTSHGGKIRQVSEPKIVESSLDIISTESLIERTCFISTNTEQFRDFISDLSEKLNSGFKKKVFGNLDEITEATGNTVAADGRNFWDVQIEAVEKIQMTFDENGEHNYQTIVHPDQKKKLDENPPTKEQEITLQKLIEKKREEYYAQKRIRRLS
jgi:hypothetical protein